MGWYSKGRQVRGNRRFLHSNAFSDAREAFSVLLISFSGEMPHTPPTRHCHGAWRLPQESGPGPRPSDTPTLVTGCTCLALLSDIRLLGRELLDIFIFALMIQASNQWLMISINSEYFSIRQRDCLLLV